MDGTIYYGSLIALTNTVTFNPASGSTTDRTRKVSNGSPIGELPIATRTAYEFIGWFTSNNVQVTSNTIITEDITLTAHWQKVTGTALIGTRVYDTLQDAINGAPANTQTTILLLKNAKENLNVPANKNIIIDLDGNTLSNNTNAAAIENYGTLSVMNGTLTSNSSNNSVINVESGNLTVLNANILATGARQAVYLYGGTAEITGTSYLTSKTSGAYNNVQRATVQNMGGTLIITGGTIESTAQHAISNVASLTIGTKDGNVDATTPILIGKTNGVKSTTAFNFYDGIIKGRTAAINGNINDQETNTTITNSTETISGVVYKTSYLTVNQ